MAGPEGPLAGAESPRQRNLGGPGQSHPSGVLCGGQPGDGCSGRPLVQTGCKRKEWQEASQRQRRRRRLQEKLAHPQAWRVMAAARR